MGVPLRNFAHFEDHFRNVKDDADLFAFLLYSSAEAHRPVAEFARTHIDFFNELAVSQKMYFYFFILKKSNVDDNPSAEMAALFDVNLNELPGLVLFDRLGVQEGKGIFFPIRNDLFKDSQRAERRLMELFSQIGALRREADKSKELVSGLLQLLPTWKRQEQMAPIWDYAAGQARLLKNLPSDLVTKMAEGVTRGLIGHII